MKANLFVVALALGLPTLATAAERPKAPNIVLILVDDMGLGDLGCYGGKEGATKQIDRLAAEGVRFASYYCGAPICSPSRVALTTGMYPGRWRINSYLHSRKGNRAHDQADWLDPKAPSLARVLKDAGYATGHFGKWHLGGGRDVDDAPKPSAYGFDESLVSSHPLEGMGPALDPKTPRAETTAAFIARTLAFLKENKDRPCYVNLWLMDVHNPFDPSEEALKKQGEGADLQRRRFRAVLSEMDRQIGRFLDGLGELGLDEKTLVLFAGDNGPNPPFGRDRTLGLRGQKWSLYEGGIRVPFLARWKGVTTAGRVNEKTVLSAVDLLPSLCKLAGAKPPKEAADGEDLSAALLGETSSRTKPLFWEYGRNADYLYPKDKDASSPNVAVRDGKWKLLVNADGTGAELYDIDADPKEAKNLAPDQADVVKQLTQEALKWRKALP